MKRYIRSNIGNYRGYDIEIEKSGDQRYYFVDDYRKIHYADLEDELKSKIDEFIEKRKPVEATIAWTGEPDSYYNEYINRLADQRLESRIHSWRDVYKEFEKIADRYFPDADKIDQEVNKLYFKHSKNPYFQEAWKRWGDSAAEDPEELEYMYDEVESAVKTKVKPFVVTYMYDDGDAENGPHPYGGEDIVYAEDEDEACRQWEEYCDADRLEGYAGCTARLATPDDVDRLESEKKEYGIMDPVSAAIDLDSLQRGDIVVVLTNSNKLDKKVTLIPTRFYSYTGDNEFWSYRLDNDMFTRFYITSIVYNASDADDAFNFIKKYRKMSVEEFLQSTGETTTEVEDDEYFDLSETLYTFLQDVAQETGAYEYGDFRVLTNGVTKEEKLKLLNFRRRYRRAAENQDQKKCNQIGAEMADWFYTLK